MRAPRQVAVRQIHVKKVTIEVDQEERDVKFPIEGSPMGMIDGLH
jgi:hypothetical protein